MGAKTVLDYTVMTIEELRARFAVRMGMFAWVYYPVNDHHFLYPMDRGDIGPFEKLDREWVEEKRTSDWTFWLYDSFITERRFLRSKSPTPQMANQEMWGNFGLVVEAMDRGSRGFSLSTDTDGKFAVAFVWNGYHSAKDENVERAALVAALQATEVSE